MLALVNADLRGRLGAHVLAVHINPTHRRGSLFTISVAVSWHKMDIAVCAVAGSHVHGSRVCDKARLADGDRMLSGLKIGHRKGRNPARITLAVDLHLCALRSRVDRQLSRNDGWRYQPAFFLGAFFAHAPSQEKTVFLLAR